MNVQTIFACAWLFSASIGAQAEELIRLPKQATSPQLGVRAGGIGPVGTQRKIAGWLVLNGATIRNVEYPELAKLLRENYQLQGRTLPDTETTPLPKEAYEAKSSGEIVRGYAICPSTAICGALPGEITAFDLDARR
jgi:hypothetical protein